MVTKHALGEFDVATGLSLTKIHMVTKPQNYINTFMVQLKYSIRIN